MPYTLNESIFQGAVDLLIEQKVLTAKQILELLKRNGVTLYSNDIEELLHLRQDTLKCGRKSDTNFAIAQKAVSMIIKKQRLDIIIVEKLIVTALLTQIRMCIWNGDFYERNKFGFFASH